MSRGECIDSQKAGKLRRMLPAIVRGMLVATLGAGVLLVCQSCLVVSPTHYDDTQLPANLRIVEPASFTRVPATEDPACGSAGQWMAFVVDVSDGNPNDDLVARLFINGVNVRGNYSRGNGKLQRGPLRVCATQRELQHPCNHVEMVVSSAFDESAGNKYDTRDPNDFALVEWWVLPSADQDPNATAIDCSNLIDAGTP